MHNAVHFLLMTLFDIFIEPVAFHLESSSPIRVSVHVHACPLSSIDLHSMKDY